MNAHERAEKLCREAESLGLDNPTEGMISEAFADMEFNHAGEIRRLNAELSTARESAEKLAEEVRRLKETKD